ncbi:hypothetical protein [Rhodoferax sp. GW822-FHT02A01]|uniref:hypothetical protein n=1 Tax=Rhodoferax sp. GW822-FHT02A01 TaxID=3141537 RepID=UPI00315C8B6F
MLPSNRTELVEELNATDERYVRKKLALNGYLDWQRPVAQHWLDERNTERVAAARRWTTMLTIIGIVVAVIGLIVRHYSGG